MKFLRSARALLGLALATALASAARAETADAAPPGIPDVEVQDQTGRTLRFYSDLVRGKCVAINFLFTGCSTVCPQLGATSAALARELAAAHDGRLQVISISFDPGADTPARLREWSAEFGAAPGWTLVTGKRRDIDTLLRALQVYTADKNLHSANFLLGHADTGEWRRLPGTTAPAQLAATLRALAAAHPPAPATPAAPAAARYFPDVPLVDQDGNARRFYSELIHGRVVVINTIFADCGSVCPLTTQRFAKVQQALGDRVGRDVLLLSITVDPLNDTPARLRSYAAAAGAKPGWLFLTGEKANVDLVLKKLGQYVESRDAHSNLIIVGNEPTGLWKKAFGLAPPEDIVRVVDSVVNDRR